MANSIYSIEKLRLQNGTVKYIIVDGLGLPIATDPAHFDSEDDAYNHLLALLLKLLNEENERINKKEKDINNEVEKDRIARKKINDEIARISKILERPQRTNKIKI